jgi:EAL domain-containing protein (putative c-di-GMP-specific phosphodiesterase class I)
VNITLHTLPYLCRLPISWNGGIELVEWELSLAPHFRQLRGLVQSIQGRGMSVWADDVTAATLKMWLKIGVNGLKVEIEAIRNDTSFIEQIKLTKLPIIVEKIENKLQHEFIKNLGIVLAQGFYYGLRLPEDLVLLRENKVNSAT